MYWWNIQFVQYKKHYVTYIRVHVSVLNVLNWLKNKTEILFRSFPGFFRKEVRGKKRFGPYKRPEKRFLVGFFLFDRHYEKTPKGETELQLILAGLGRRSLTITENMTHSEVRSTMLFFLFLLCWVTFFTLFYSAFDN